jgi:hypothetical protein
MTPTLFESLVQMFANIKMLSIEWLEVIKNNKYIVNCFECIELVFKSISKLNRLKILKIIKFDFKTLKAIQNNINEQTFKRLEELKLKRSFNDRKKMPFIDLIESMSQLCYTNPKQLFTVKTDLGFIHTFSASPLCYIV